MGTVKTGGDKSYVYDAKKEYSSVELKELAPQVVTTSYREPPVGKQKELFGPKQSPLKRIGIIVFESQIQPTRSGLAGDDQIYVSDQGKQLLTEKLLSIWEQSFKVLGSDLDFVSISKIKKAPSFYKYGSSVDDYVNSQRSSIAPDDIFFQDRNKKTTANTIFNSRGMRDMTFVMVPGYDMMEGPKWSEQNKHFLNDVAKELQLDGLIIVMSELSWTTAHTDKHSGEYYPEEIKSKVKASTLVPLSQYHERLGKNNMSDKPNVTICYRAYESELKIPAKISLSEESKTFENIESELLSPMLKTYKDQAQATIMRISDDLKKTW
jgi:hypothetical protein